MIAPARRLSCLSMPRARICEQSNPAGTRAFGGLVMMRAFCCAFAELAVRPENVPRPITARKTPVRTTNSPIKTRRLKNADCEVDFCFIMEFELSFSVGSFKGDQETSQHVF